MAPTESTTAAGASAAAIQHHYDLSDDFFGLWLGPERVYSAALFEGDDDLEAAQMRKLDHHIAAAAAAGKARVLDVGCGWGALLRRLTRHAGVQHAVGLTLSASQAAFARQRAGPEIEVREESWRDHKPEAPYDAIISIGAFEHFARPGLSPEEKLGAYREFFAFCRDGLRMGGRLSLQTIAYSASGITLPAFIAERVFRESELPLIHEPIAAADPDFELVALRNDRDHYARTLVAWERNLMARRAEAAAIVGEEAVTEFLRYLRVCAMAFKLDAICLLRMSFVKRDPATSILPASFRPR
ncbi:MAG TPA: cyclopropane-fatty-acyl-phospholipid synthase family protein [Bauldia sp.]|nr:cyclopropane-fatty-acyl-phospholipid synthase family protein [Bauldia sp.]